MGEGGKGPGQGRKGAVRAPPKERFNKTAAILGLGANSAGHRAGRSPSQGSRSKGSVRVAPPPEHLRSRLCKPLEKATASGKVWHSRGC